MADEERRASEADNSGEEEPPMTEAAPPPPADENPPGLVQEDDAGSIGSGGSGGAGGGAPPQEDSGPPPNVKQPIVPLGVATSKALLDRDLNPFILDKMFHQGTMGRFATAGGIDAKVKDGGSAQYEYHKWQLDHMFREVPQEMKAGLGIVRAKPEALLYEEEKFILGKMERNLREVEGSYAPIAANRESEMEINPDVKVPTNLPKEPPPCMLPIYEDDEDDICAGGKYRGAPSKNPSRAQQRGPQGPKYNKGDVKQYQMAYGGNMQEGVASSMGGGQQQTTAYSAVRTMPPCGTSFVTKKGPETQMQMTYKYADVESRPSPPPGTYSTYSDNGPAQGQGSAPAQYSTSAPGGGQRSARGSAQGQQGSPQQSNRGSASMAQGQQSPGPGSARGSGASAQGQDSCVARCQQARSNNSSGGQQASPQQSGQYPAQGRGSAQYPPSDQPSSQYQGSPQGPSGGLSGGGAGACRTNAKAESHIQAVCNAARNAMAIYDTLAGTDNFPCNVGDRMEAVEDGVWSWLYTLIYKLVPLDMDANSNNIPPRQ